MKPIAILLFISILFLTSCNNNQGEKLLFNENASLPASFKFNDGDLKMMASFIDKKSGSMSVLYTGGRTRTLVTWKQKSDENWFGANIPNQLLSVEVVKSTALRSGLAADYKNYNNKGLLVRKDTAWQRQRVNYILGQQSSFMP
ncbi:MAG: hypothetical protein M3O71_06510 [Bacteroidota bacterium]|nr:hypothetical protein [Bacteroidota bacterium]